MDRRNFIKHAAWVYAGLCCAAPEILAQAAEAKLEFGVTGESLTTLEKVVDTILPKNDIPGALDLKLQDFVVLMLKDCASPKDQVAFVRGLSAVDAISQAKYQKAFKSLESKQRESLLHIGLTGKGVPMEVNHLLSDFKTFVNLTKGHVVNGFMQSQYVMTEVFPHVQIPGPFQAEVPITQSSF